MIWVGKNLAEHGVISCIYYARDVGNPAAAIRQVSPDWKRPIGRPSHNWLRAIEADIGPLNFGLAIAWR